MNVSLKSHYSIDVSKAELIALLQEHLSDNLAVMAMPKNGVDVIVALTPNGVALKFIKERTA